MNVLIKYLPKNSFIKPYFINYKPEFHSNKYFIENILVKITNYDRDKVPNSVNYMVNEKSYNNINLIETYFSCRPFWNKEKKMYDDYFLSEVINISENEKKNIYVNYRLYFNTDKEKLYEFKTNKIFDKFNDYENFDILALTDKQNNKITNNILDIHKKITKDLL